MKCRSEAQKVAGITEKQYAGLALGPRKGRNNRTGTKHTTETKEKISRSNKEFWSANPELAAARGKKNRAENNYMWKGGITRINSSIRGMQENRIWMDAVKARDGQCTKCGNLNALEAHHVPPLSELISSLGIKTRDDARRHASTLWDIGNGVTLCMSCHYAEHGRTMPESGYRSTNFATCEFCSAVIISRRNRKFCSRACKAKSRSVNRIGILNNNWKGGLVLLNCRRCGSDMYRKRTRASVAKFCSRECTNASRRKDVCADAPTLAGIIQESA